MTRIKHRSVLLGLSLAALLVPALAAGVPPAAAAARSAASSCDAPPVFFGLHGMNEGPSDTVGTISTLIVDLDRAQNDISGAVLNSPIPYPIVSFSSFITLKHLPATVLEDGVQAGENNLQERLKSWTQGCTPSQDKIVLVGYSMGAWVINKWLMEHSNEWGWIKGVLLYGDPCWIDGSDVGLARAYRATGCMSAKSYPSPGAGFRIPYRSYCEPGDGVCGGGFGAKNNPLKLANELGAALGCAKGSCAHFDYTADGPSTWDLVNGATLMVQWLGVPELA